MRTPPLPADYLCQGLQTNLRKTLDTTNSLRPSISITEGWSDQRERNPKENATCRNKSHFLLNLGFNLDIFQW